MYTWAVLGPQTCELIAQYPALRTALGAIHVILALYSLAVRSKNINTELSTSAYSQVVVLLHVDLGIKQSITRAPDNCQPRIGSDTWMVKPA